jgi:hypothetical protein
LGFDCTANQRVTAAELLFDGGLADEESSSRRRVGCTAAVAESLLVGGSADTGSTSALLVFCAANSGARVQASAFAVAVLTAGAALPRSMIGAMAAM